MGERLGVLGGTFDPIHCGHVLLAQSVREQLDLDSMDFLDIVMELRKQYKVEVPEEDYPELASLTSCVNYLEPKMKDL